MADSLIEALEPPGPGVDVDGWAGALAKRLLRETVLMIGGQRHRLREVEIYLRAPHHPDPFAHAHPVQQRVAGWYFHRAGGGGYRGGTFKGLDLSCGAPGVYGGVLLRSVEGPGGLVDGSCNVVDHLLRVGGFESVAALDEAIGGRRADDPASPLRLDGIDGIDGMHGTDGILATARVGLTLKRAGGEPTMPAYIGRRLRFLTRPGQIKKGRVQTLLALHAAGESVEAIAARTGSPRSAIERAVAAYEAGRAALGFASFIGRALRTAELCRVLGAWDAVYGSGAQKQGPWLPQGTEPSG